MHPFHEFVTKFLMANMIAGLVIIVSFWCGAYSTLQHCPQLLLFFGVCMGTLIGMIPSREWKKDYRSL